MDEQRELLLAMHAYGSVGVCNECARPWPCDTVRVLLGKLDIEMTAANDLDLAIAAFESADADTVGSIFDILDDDALDPDETDTPLGGSGRHSMNGERER